MLVFSSSPKRAKKANDSMTHAQKMKAIIENAKSNTEATVWLDRFRSIREAEGPQRLPSVRPSHNTPKKR